MTPIEYRIGDATRPKGDSATKVIAHICNDAGAWGAGFVLALSKRWPLPRATYHRAFHPQRSIDPGRPVLGDVQFVEIPRSYTVGEGGIVVANMIAQTGYGFRNGPPIRYDALETCLRKVATFATREPQTSVHMPRIGTGLAGGTWDKIEPLIEKTLSQLDIPVTVYDLPVRKS